MPMVLPVLDTVMIPPELLVRVPPPEFWMPTLLPVLDTVMIPLLVKVPVLIMVPELVMVPVLVSVYPDGIVNVMPEFILRKSGSVTEKFVMFIG